MADDPYARIKELEAELQRRDAELRGAFAENAALRADGELRDRTLSETLEQQSATAEVLRVIASSPSDLQVVLNTVVERAAVLCGADWGLVQQREGDAMMIVARYGARPFQVVAEVSASSRGGVPLSRTSGSSLTRWSSRQLRARS